MRKIYRASFVWTAATLAVILFTFSTEDVFAQRVGAPPREEAPPAGIGDGLPFLSGEQTPSFAYNTSRQRVEMVVPARGANGYVKNVAYATFSTKSGWSAPVFITDLPHDVLNAHVAVAQNGAVVVAFEVAETLNRIYIMVQDPNSGEWSAPAGVSDPAVPSHEPRILVSNREVTVFFRASTGDGANSNRIIVVNGQENIPIW